MQKLESEFNGLSWVSRSIYIYIYGLRSHHLNQWVHTCVLKNFHWQILNFLSLFYQEGNVISCMLHYFYFHFFTTARYQLTTGSRWKSAGHQSAGSVGRPMYTCYTKHQHKVLQINWWQHQHQAHSYTCYWYHGLPDILESAKSELA